jgi:hypothetical protein
MAIRQYVITPDFGGLPAKALHTKLVADQLPRLYRLICAVTQDEIFGSKLSEVTKTILLESKELRDLRKAARRKAHNLKNNLRIPGNEEFICLQCAQFPPTERCVRTLHVRFGDQVSNHGSALVAYPPDDADSMIPKVNSIYIYSIFGLNLHKVHTRSDEPKGKKGTKVTMVQPKRISLESIGLNGIRERPGVQSRCGRDVTFLVNEENNEEVSPRFNVHDQVRLLTFDISRWEE